MPAPARPHRHLPASSTSRRSRLAPTGSHPAPTGVLRGALALVAALALAACGGRSEDRPTDPAGRAFALARAERARVVAAGFEPDRRVIDAAHAALAASHGARGLDLARADADDAGAPRLVLATVDSDLGRALLERAGGWLLDDGGFRMAGRSYRGELDLVRLSMADPQRPGLPLAAWLANRPAALARASVLCEFDVRPRFECYRAGALVAWGRLTADGPVAEGDVVTLRRDWGRLERRTLDEDPEWTVVDHTDPVAFARVFGRLASEHREPIARTIHRLPIEAAARVYEREEDAEAAVRDAARFGLVVWLPTDRVELAQLLASPHRTVEGAGVVLRYAYSDRDGHEPLIASTWRSEADTGRELSADEVRAAVAAFSAVHAHVALAPVLLSTPSTGFEAREKRGDAAALTDFAERWAEHCEDAALLAQACGVDALHLATAVPSITRSIAPEDEAAGAGTGAGTGGAADAYEQHVLTAYSQAWNEGIARARASFDGELWYVAMDAWEIERIGFGDQLDALGVELMPGLIDRTGTRVEGGLARRMGVALGHARAAAGERRLVAFTGMPATSDGPSDPRMPRGPIDVDVQREFLEAVRILIDESDPPLDGLVLEEWAVDPRREGGRGFDLAREHLSEALGQLPAAMRGAAER